MNVDLLHDITFQFAAFYVRQTAFFSPFAPFFWEISSCIDNIYSRCYLLKIIWVIIRVHVFLFVFNFVLVILLYSILR